MVRGVSLIYFLRILPLPRGALPVGEGEDELLLLLVLAAVGGWGNGLPVAPDFFTAWTVLPEWPTPPAFPLSFGGNWVSASFSIFLTVDKAAVCSLVSITFLVVGDEKMTNDMMLLPSLMHLAGAHSYLDADAFADDYGHDPCCR
ncbi:unnamed protein product [Sphagnum tenellum]